MSAAEAEARAAVLVLGVGNLLLADDGVGLELLDLLRADFAGAGDIEFVDGGTQGLALLGLLSGRAALVLLDAVALGAEAGTPHVLRSAERVADARRLGAHEGNACELLAAAALLGELPPTVRIVGVEPDDFVTRIGLSPAVQRGLAPARVLARKLIRELRDEWARKGTAACTS